jgi:hypothetical protein
MAAARFTDPIEPMTLGNMRANGVRSLAVQCHQCRHELIMNVDYLPGDLTVPSFDPRGVHQALKRCPRVLCVSPIEAVGPEMRVVLQILAMTAAVVVAGIATYFIVTFLLRFF